MNIFRFFKRKKDSAQEDKGLRGTTSGKLFVDKTVFYKRKDVREAINKLKDSVVIREQLRTE